MEHSTNQSNVIALECARDAERGGNPLIKDTPRETLGAIRAFAQLLAVGAALDDDLPTGMALGMQVLLGALDAEVLKKVPHE